MVLNQQHELTIDQQVATVHVQGTLVSTVDDFDKLLHTCHWRGYSVEISCRSEEGEWVPYHLNYQPDASELEHAAVNSYNEVLSAELV